LHLLNKDQFRRISTESIQLLPFIFKIPIRITPNDLFLFGKKYHLGEGIPINTMETMKYYKLSANLNDISGMKVYSLTLKEGLARIINLEEAIKYEQLSIFTVSFSKFIQPFQQKISQLKNLNYNSQQEVSQFKNQNLQMSAQ
jgi:hypothetical protein